MTHTFTVSRDFGRLTAEVVVNDDGTFTIAGAGPYHIEHAPVSRSDYGHGCAPSTAHKHIQAWKANGNGHKGA